MNILEYENYQEKISHGNPLFPYITYLCSIPLDFSYVPIHWHDEMEIIYIKKGHGIITVDFTQYQVSAGTLALIIPGQLHSIEQYENESMEYENIIFHPQILLSKQTDTCSTDYFSPYGKRHGASASDRGCKRTDLHKRHDAAGTGTDGCRDRSCAGRGRRKRPNGRAGGECDLHMVALCRYRPVFYQLHQRLGHFITAPCADALVFAVLSGHRGIRRIDLRLSDNPYQP